MIRSVTAICLRLCSETGNGGALEPEHLRFLSRLGCCWTPAQHTRKSTCCAPIGRLFHGGTEGLNPLPSSAESAANSLRTSVALVPESCRPELKLNSALMYVSILVALRTVRFEPGYVLLAGGCAALGWLTLFLYAVWGSDGAVFTRSYVEYVIS